MQLHLARELTEPPQKLPFVGPDAGGEHAAIVHTITETAKLNGLDPEAYVAAILSRLAAGYSINSIADLLPWNFRPGPLLVAMS